MSSSETFPALETKSLPSMGTIPRGEQPFVPSSNKNNGVPKGTPNPGREPSKQLEQENQTLQSKAL